MSTHLDGVATLPQSGLRVQAVNLLRGLVIVLMAIDHTRDYMHSGAMAFRPEDLTQTTRAIFLTRWITHFCAPAFMFCAGIGAFLRLERGGSKADLSRFLATRGLWLIVLEFTLVRASFFFDLTFNPLFLLVLWALGWSMVALALLVYVPPRILLIASIAMIALHNLTDGVQASSFGSVAWIWQILHQQGLWMPFAGGPAFIVAYPLIPWIGVMAAGFCFGEVYRLPPERRRQPLLRLGLALIAAFVLLRAVNVYGDTRPWAVQDRGPVYTLLSFLNATKYPASLSFLLMTLGPAIVFLGLMDGARRGDRDPVLVFGRVPLFFFVLHIPLIHLLAVALTALRHGAGAPFVWLAPPTLGTARDRFPADYGWDLWVVYAVWVVALGLSYPLCRWFGALKRRRAAGWLSYF